MGIRVLVVEPGPFRTDWAGRSLKQSPNFIGDYEKSADKRRREIAAHSGEQAGDPARAAEAVIKAWQSPTPPRHLVLGRAGVANVENQLRSMAARGQSLERPVWARNIPQHDATAKAGVADHEEPDFFEPAPVWFNLMFSAPSLRIL